MTQRGWIAGDPLCEAMQRARGFLRASERTYDDPHLEMAARAGDYPGGVYELTSEMDAAAAETDLAIVHEAEVGQFVEDDLTPLLRAAGLL